MARIEFTARRGNLGSDPEFFTTSNDNLGCRLSVAVTPRWKNKDGEWVDGETSWINAVAWEWVAEQIETWGLKTGDAVFIEGTMEQDTYEVEYEDGTFDEETRWNFQIKRLFPHAKFDEENYDYNSGSSKKKKKRVKKRKPKSSGSRSSSRSSSRSIKPKTKSKGGSVADKVLAQLNR